MRKFIFTLILILAGYIAYMYFFGKGADKSGAETIVRESKEVVKSVGEFLKHQKEKYNEGEFDHLIEKVEKSIHQLKSTTTENKGEVRDGLQALKQELQKIDTLKLSEEDKQQLKKIQDEIGQELR
jgi:hypothetical protein